jgi:hypothetical protein
MHRRHPIDHILDGGYKSRKMIMAYVIMVLGIGAFGLTARFPALAASLSELYMFLLGAASLFISGNVAVKWVGSRGGAPLSPDLSSVDPQPETQKPALARAPAKVALPPDPDLPGH